MRLALTVAVAMVGFIAPANADPYGRIVSLDAMHGPGRVAT